MGLKDSLAGAMDTRRDIELKSEITIEELFEIINASDACKQWGPVKLKKFLGKKIAFPKVSRATATVTVKGNKVSVKKTVDSANSGVSVGGVNVSNIGKNPVKALEEGNEYFAAVCDAVAAVLADK